MFQFSINDELELRLLEERQAEELFALVDRNRAYLREWLPWLDANTSVEDSRAFIRGTLEQFARNDGFQAGIWFQGQLAGLIGYHGIQWGNRSTEIGYWLGASFQGHGFMTQACRALVNYAFRELALNRVGIHCAEGNHKSRAIPERLGFQQEGVLRQAEHLYGRYVDQVVYAVLVGDWPAESNSI